jgi:uncharacterized protein (TIGR02265 family)
VLGEFGRPDLHAPLDVRWRVENCPEGAVKGMFFEMIVSQARRNGGDVGRDRYTSFRGYPLSEWLAVLPRAAELAFPHLPAREGMRRFGRTAYDTFTSSTAGRVLFSLAGRNPSMAARLAGRAFDVIGSHGRVHVIDVGDNYAILGLRDMWDYIDSWHVGIYEGALAALDLTGEVRVRTTDRTNGDLEVRWR